MTDIMTADPVNQFNTDYDQLLKDANAWNDAVKAQQAAIKEYMEGFAHLFGKKMDPLMLMVMFIYLLGNAGGNMLDQSTGVGGSVLAVQGDLDKCTNDINQITDTTDKDPNTGKPGSFVDIAAQDESKMLNLLGSNSSPEGTFIQGAIGDDATKSLFSSILTVRRDTFDQFDDVKPLDPNYKNYNPAWVDPSKLGQGIPRTYHFDAAAPAYDPNNTDPNYPNSQYIGSFADLNTFMSMAGDPCQATQAAQLKTQNFSAFTNTMNSGQAATQQSLSQDSKTTQTIQSFMSNLAHSLMSVVSVAMQNIAKASS